MIDGTTSRLWERTACFLFILCLLTIAALPASAEPVSSAGVEFGLHLFRELYEQSPSANIGLSPWSVSTALVIPFNGASGETREAMARTLQLNGLELAEINAGYSFLFKDLESLNPGMEISSGNSLWAHQDFQFRPQFRKTMGDNFSAEITTLDLKQRVSLDRINQWVLDKSAGNIPTMLTSEDLGAVMFLVNTFHFKGAWSVGFNAENTRSESFFREDAKPVDVPMMVSSSREYSFLSSPGFQAVSLPYGDGRLALYLFLPDEDSDLKSLVKSLAAEKWEHWMAGFKRETTRITLPRFQVSYEATLNEALTVMGMGVALYTPGNIPRDGRGQHLD